MTEFQPVGIKDRLAGSPPDFFASKLLTGRQLKLAGSVRVAFAANGINYPPYVRGQQTHENLVGILDDRLKVMPAVRRQIVKEATRIYGLVADETLAVQIGAMVAGPMNRIFSDQLRLGKAVPVAWCAASPEGADLLKIGIAKVLRSKYFETFLRKNPGFQMTLVELAKLTDISDKQELAKSWQRLEKAALISYEAGQPGLMAEMSEYYTDLEGSSNSSYRLLEADIRVILPVDRETRKMIEDVAGEQWEKLKVLNHDRPDLARRKLPPLIIGMVALSGGTQSLSLVTGEAFAGNGVVLPLNAYRTDEAFKKTRKLLASSQPENELNMQLLMYIGHELAHKARLVTGKLKYMQETGPDVSMLIANLRSILSHDASGERGLLGQYLSAFVTEYGVLSTDFEKPYQVSSATVLNELVDAELVNFVDIPVKKMTFDTSVEKVHNLLRTLVAHHEAIYIQKDQVKTTALAGRSLNPVMQSLVAEITAD